MRIKELFENNFSKIRNISESYDYFYNSRDVVETVNEKLYKDSTAPKDYDYELLFDRIYTELKKNNITSDTDKLESETGNIISLYAEDNKLNFSDLFNKVIPIAIDYLKKEDHYTLGGVTDYESLEDLVKYSKQRYTDRNSFYGYYVDILPSGKLLVDLDKKIYRDKSATRGVNFMHFIVKLEDSLNLENQDRNKEESANLIKLYLADNNVDYYNFFNKVVPMAREYLTKNENNTLKNIKSLSDLKRLIDTGLE